jgi:16S rRNA (cytidine1402-2'-O)-methyltransferase
MSAGTLFVVATPIGNLEDITLRALRVLREAHLIAAEDTRRTARLLAHHGISTPTSSFHEHNARQRLPGLLAALANGRSIALVTDAGTPGVSDPGVELVSACLRADIPVDPVPGVSAPLTAALASGFPMIPLTILGFAPHRSTDRKTWFATLAETKHTITFFEAPHKIHRTLGELATILGNRPIMAGRELTKLHQQFIFGTAATVLTSISEPRGEFTIVVGPAEIVSDSTSIGISDEAIAADFSLVTNISGMSRRQAIADVANRLGKSTRDVYSAVERVKKARS